MDLLETQVSQLARALNDTVHVAAAGYLDLCEVALYQTELPLSPLPDLATLDAAECTFVGYARGVITWQTPTVSDANVVEVVGTVPVFRPTNAVTPNQAWGLYIVDTGGTLLYYLGQFDNAPLPMVSHLDQMLITIRYRPATRSIAVVVS